MIFLLLNPDATRSLDPFPGVVVPFHLTPLAAASTPRPLRVKEVMPMSSHGTRGITVEAARR